MNDDSAAPSRRIIASPWYGERVSAGLLGKVVGVYLGRPFEGWTYERIRERLGGVQ